MPGPTFGLDKCLDGQMPRRTNAWTWLQAFANSRHLSFDAFVQAGQTPEPGICPSRHYLLTSPFYEVTSQRIFYITKDGFP